MDLLFLLYRIDTYQNRIMESMTDTIQEGAMQVYRITESFLDQQFQRLVDFYSSANVAMFIASAVVSVSMLLTCAILAQGSEHTIFREGLVFFSGKSRRRHIQDEAETDAAEEALFPGNVPSPKSKTVAEMGIDAFMNSAAPVLTIILACLICVFAWYAASVGST